MNRSWEHIQIHIFNCTQLHIQLHIYLQRYAHRYSTSIYPNTSCNQLNHQNQMYISVCLSQETVKLVEYHDCELERNRYASCCDLPIAFVCVVIIITKVWMVAVNTYSYTNNCNVLIDIKCKYSNIDWVCHGINISHVNSSVIRTRVELVVKQCKLENFEI